MDLPDISAVVPVQYQIYVIVAGLVFKYGAEFYSTVRAGGGLKRIIMSFWFGEQLPKVIAEDYKKELSTPPFDTTTAKSLVLLLLLSCAVPIFFVGCATAPSERVQQVQTLKAVGHTAEAAVAASAQLYAAGTITPAQARKVMDIYDQRFQPAYRVAVNAVNANLDSLASPELIAIAAELSALILTYQTH